MKVLSFLLEGRVQKVKMRRYIESAGRYLEVQGYVINTTDGAVFGEAWSCSDDTTTNLDAFETWIRGEWPSLVYTDIKPTPLGTAYPSKASVESCTTIFTDDNNGDDDIDFLMKQFAAFTMVRDNTAAEQLLSKRQNIVQQLCAKKNEDGTAMSWPNK